MPVTSCSGTNTKSNFSGHVIITMIISCYYDASFWIAIGSESFNGTVFAGMSAFQQLSKQSKQGQSLKISLTPWHSIIKPNKNGGSYPWNPLVVCLAFRTHSWLRHSWVLPSRQTTHGFQGSDPPLLAGFIIVWVQDSGPELAAAPAALCLAGQECTKFLNF